jgi:hypothetical protein
MSRTRRIWVWVLIIGASLIGLASILTTWVERQMLDQQAWKTASTELIENPRVRDALSVYLVDELYDNVDVASALGERLPENLQPLAGPVAGALREPATKAVERLLEAPRTQTLFVNASVFAQEKLLNVLENKTGAGITTGDGVVTVDLGQLVKELGTELGLPASALDRIPPDAGQLTVLRSDRLAAAQAGVQALRVLSVFLLVLVLGMFALAVFLARGERRETIRNVAWAFVLVGLTVLVVRRLAGEYAVNSLVQPGREPAGHQVWLISSSVLSQIGWATILYGVLGLAGTLFAGPTTAATSVRRRAAVVLNGRQGIAWAVVGSLFLLLVLWGPTRALREFWGILLLGSLAAAGLVALRHQTLREFPEAGANGAGGQFGAVVSQAAPVGAHAASPPVKEES